MLIASYYKTILLTSTDTEVQKNEKSGMYLCYKILLFVQPFHSPLS